QVEGNQAATIGQHASNLGLEAEVTLGKAMDQQDLRPCRIAPFVDGKPCAVGCADIGACRHFFSTFQSTVTGAFSQPTTLARAAPGPNHMPSQPYCACSRAR